MLDPLDGRLAEISVENIIAGRIISLTIDNSVTRSRLCRSTTYLPLQSQLRIRRMISVNHGFLRDEIFFSEDVAVATRCNSRVSRLYLFLYHVSKSCIVTAKFSVKRTHLKLINMISSFPASNFNESIEALSFLYLQLSNVAKLQLF